MSINKFSKDPKSEVISLEEMIINNNYFIDLDDEVFDYELWEYSTRYKITGKHFVLVEYTEKAINFGEDYTYKLEKIIVAYRDGVTEYQIYNNEINNLLNKKENLEKGKERNKINKRLRELRKVIAKIPNFINQENTNFSFNSCFSYADYHTSHDELKNKYVVFDVETNGLRNSNDDLLSLSIYDPTTSLCYTRYFPLDLQPIVLTRHINGINENMLDNCPHWIQDEVNNIIDTFDLKNKILLSYSASGKFDKTFITNYCKRHNITGFENLNYDNIFWYKPSGFIGKHGQLSKDNLCLKLGIDGVEKVHNSLNDCILEWKLFENFQTRKMFFIDNLLYEYNSNYIIPISYINKIPKLIDFAKISIPYIDAQVRKYKTFNLPQNILTDALKFPTNITGASLERRIKAKFNATRQDNINFLIENKSKLKLIAKFESIYDEISITENKDGSLNALNPIDKEDIEIVNKVSNYIIEGFEPAINFIKENIFCNEEILDQELVVSEDNKILDLCDFSSYSSIFEFKTTGLFDRDNNLYQDYARQLYYQSKGRNIYIGNINFIHNDDVRDISSLKDIIFEIYEVKLTPKCNHRNSYILTKLEKEFLTYIVEDNYITIKKLREKTGSSKNAVECALFNLKHFDYIKEKTHWRDPWIILREPTDDITYEDEYIKKHNL